MILPPLVFPGVNILKLSSAGGTAHPVVPVLVRVEGGFILVDLLADVASHWARWVRIYGLPDGR